MGHKRDPRYLEPLGRSPSIVMDTSDACISWCVVASPRGCGTT